MFLVLQLKYGHVVLFLFETPPQKKTNSACVEVFLEI